jgi:xanthine/CO dehydrogenase XdhC/CoxF family maturation factor
MALIDEKREKGFRPILMIDANKDWVTESHKKQGNKLRKFMSECQLCDPFYEKFKTSPRIYVDGQHRLDYILIDPALNHAVKYVGHLGSLEANNSDHSLVDIHRF